MELDDFVAMVDGALQYELEREDKLFQQFSIFTTQQMLSTGNFKKNTDVNKLAKTVYLPLADRLEGSDSKVKYVGESKIAENRKKLRERFNITE